MIDSAALSKTLQRQVVVVIDDLRLRADEVDEVRDHVAGEYTKAQEAGRTAHDLSTWREGLLAQVAVSWVLGTVFVRFCEDNGLVVESWISGAGEKKRWAADNKREFFRNHPEAGERAYLENVFTQAAKLPGLANVFGQHNPLWSFGPTDDAVRELDNLWKSADPETAELVWDFTDSNWDTRFLGDLYQDLSEHAKKTFALLQTPDFIEEFILDRTLEPALDEFGLGGHAGEGFRLIDPACGSGHFLLGAFDRLAQRYFDKSPDSGRRDAAAKALGSVFGVDLNPFAASIARFRLLLAALRFSEVTTLAEAPFFNPQVAVGDSLLHGPAMLKADEKISNFDQVSADRQHLYATEDTETVRTILSQKYDAVVANPPYITPKDPAANASYRDMFTTTHRKYSLSVPFMERLFDLAARGTESQRAGFVGQITANSFMKREFGKKLIQDYLSSKVDLTGIVDTSGAYIPGHGTPTVILFGRNRGVVGDRVRAVLGIRGEPSAPAVPAEGLVWSSIVELFDRAGAENDFVSVNDTERSVLAKHPWSLQGGAAGPLKEIVEQGCSDLIELASSIGITCFTLEDDLFLRPTESLRTRLVPSSEYRPMVEGETLRDWGQSRQVSALFPYEPGTLDVASSLSQMLERLLWPGKARLSNNKMFGGKTKVETGLNWYEYGRFTTNKLRTPLSIAFAFVATHNHFVLDRGGKVFNRTAPVIKLPEGATVEDHLQLLGLLNSSVACFWMKQVSQNKGDSTDSRGARVSGIEPWVDSYELDGTKLKQFPVANDSVLELARRMDDLATQLGSSLPLDVVGKCTPDEQTMGQSRTQTAQLRARMVWIQEELDWRCAYLYGVTSDDLSLPADEVFELQKGERAFEIALARKVAAGEAESTWFERHDSVPITELPDRWPAGYKAVIEKRLELTKSDKFVNLLERPEYKRRWNWDSWEDLAQDALRGWLLDRLETQSVWPTRQPQSVNEIADRVRTDAEFVQVAELYAGRPDPELAPLIAKLVADESVPYLSAWRYKPAGLRKRASWENTWDLQRKEDDGEPSLEGNGKIPVPPKYGSADFLKTSYWKLRGKLDVPKERFVLYSGTEREADSSAVIGWAGWDHLQQAEAVVALYNQRRNVDGWEADKLVPLLAGLAELVPWLRQWHNEFDPNIGLGLGDYYADYLAGEAQLCDTTVDALGEWYPPAKTKRAKKKKQTAKRKSAEQ